MPEQYWTEMTEQEWREAFRRNLRVQLRRKNWTQKTLAIKSGVSEHSICNYVTCKRSPPINAILKMADALDCSFYDLAGFTYIS